MPVPKRKASKARRNRRKSANQVVTASSFMDCKNCGGVIVPHQVCKNCGFYKGQKVVETKLDRAMRRGETRKVASAKSAEAIAAQTADAEAATVVVEKAPKKARNVGPKKTTSRAKKSTKE